MGPLCPSNLLAPTRQGRRLGGRRHGARSRDDVVEGLEEDLHAQDAGRVGWPVVLSDLDLVEPVQVVDRVAGDLSKDGVLVVEPLAPVEREEELGLVGVRAAARHPEQPAVREAQPAVELVLEVAAVDGLATAARAGRVARLRHEVLDHAVKLRALVTEPLLAGGRRPVPAGVPHRVAGTDHAPREAGGGAPARERAARKPPPRPGHSASAGFLRA